MNWEEAHSVIERLNKESYCGYSDWRLPTDKELESLVDRSQHNPALPQDHPFINIKSDWYWSSATFAYDTDYAWVVYLRSGRVSYSHKLYNYHVWPVRAYINYKPNEIALRKGRFWDLEDETVIDRITALMWTRDANMQEEPRK